MSFSTSSARLSFENAAGQVLEHPDGYIVFTYCPGPRQPRDLQALITHTGQLLLRKRWHHILGDQRVMQPLTNEERAWLVEYWDNYLSRHPRSLYAAVLLPQEVFARLSAGQLKQHLQDTGIRYRHFTDEVAATAWLAQQP